MNNFSEFRPCDFRNMTFVKKTIVKLIHALCHLFNIIHVNTKSSKVIVLLIDKCE